MERIEILSLDRENIEREHICCALADKKNEPGVRAKKYWLKQRMEEGLVFKKAIVRGKVFIEYIPAENAWVPVNAPGYMWINCLWVSGQYKGQGLGASLLDECLKDAEGMNGVVVLSSKTKRPFLSDKKFLMKKGFEVCDTAEPFFELLALRFRDAPRPSFKDAVKVPKPLEKGVSVFYTAQCPFTYLYIGEFETAVREMGLPFQITQLETKEQAQEHFCPFTTYSVYLDGQFRTHEILTRDKAKKLLMR